MKKIERLEKITRLLEQMGTVRVNDIVDNLKVSDMTVRRDLSELEEQGVLTRIHGGARSNNVLQYQEMSHEEKHYQYIEEKREIAKKAAQLIEDGDIIFLGPGTTVELLAEEIDNKTLRVVTNCLPIFTRLFKKKSETFNVFLLGGEMREVTQAFIGEMTNVIMDKMNFTKMFFSGNGVKKGLVMTSSFEEAYTQKLALEKSAQTYLLLDSSKVGKEDFTSICQLTDIEAVVIEKIDARIQEELETYTKVI